jgi:uncharacterized iron-regulated membrane protein
MYSAGIVRAPETFGRGAGKTKLWQQHHSDGFHTHGRYAYAPALGVLSVVFVVSGLGMTSLWWKRQLPVMQQDMTRREWHALIGTISVLPMLLLSITGVKLPCSHFGIRHLSCYTSPALGLAK